MVILEATGLALSLLEAMHCIKMCTGADALMRERALGRETKNV
jgi:hypothetical protein